MRHARRYKTPCVPTLGAHLSSGAQLSSRTFVATPRPFSTRPNRSRPDVKGKRLCPIPNRAASFCASLNLLALHRAGDVVRLPDRERHDRQRWIAGGAAGELAAIRDEQVLDVVGLAEFVHHAVPRLLAHPVATQVVGAWIGRRWIGHGGADGLVDGGSLLVGVIAHRDVVRMIV